MFIEPFVPAFQPVYRIVQPQHYDPVVARLGPKDKEEFSKLATFFYSSNDRNRRNLGLATFMKHIEMIHSFVVKGDSKDSIRGLAAGICFGDGFFLVNTSRLKTFMNRSKSCMNGSFQRFGYTVERPPSEISDFFLSVVPGAPPHFFNHRNWCLRKASKLSNHRFSSHLPSDLISKDTPRENFEFLLDVRSLLNGRAL